MTFVSSLFRLAVVLFIASLVTAAAMQKPPQSEKAAQPPDSAPRVGYIADLRARTPEERTKAKFFDRESGERLTPGRSVSIGGVLHPAPPPGAPAPTYETFLRQVLCRGDALVVGTATPQKVLLNCTETFLFTEYDVTVTRWLYPTRDGAPTIRLSVEGGRAVVGGRLTEATIGTPPVPGNEYLFMLRRIPDTQGFTIARKPVSSKESLQAGLSRFSLPAEVAADAVTFASLVDDLAKIPVSECQGGGRRGAPSPVGSSCAACW